MPHSLGLNPGPVVLRESFIHSFIHPFHTQSLRAPSVSGHKLGTGERKGALHDSVGERQL